MQPSNSHQTPIQKSFGLLGEAAFKTRSPCSTYLQVVSSSLCYRVTAEFCTKGIVIARSNGRAVETASTTADTKEKSSDGHAPEDLNAKINVRPPSSKSILLIETFEFLNFELANAAAAFCDCSGLRKSNSTCGNDSHSVSGIGLFNYITCTLKKQHSK
jgi:hypothetical protein